jgi:hypothetical protein
MNSYVSMIFIKQTCHIDIPKWNPKKKIDYENSTFFAKLLKVKEKKAIFAKRNSMR